MKCRTQQERDERLIGQAYGNLRIDNPEITREQVAERFRLRQKNEVVKVRFSLNVNWDGKECRVSLPTGDYVAFNSPHDLAAKADFIAGLILDGIKAESRGMENWLNPNDLIRGKNHE